MMWSTTVASVARPRSLHLVQNGLVARTSASKVFPGFAFVEVVVVGSSGCEVSMDFSLGARRSVLL